MLLLFALWGITDALLLFLSIQLCSYFLLMEFWNYTVVKFMWRRQTGFELRSSLQMFLWRSYILRHGDSQPKEQSVWEESQKESGVLKNRLMYCSFLLWPQFRLQQPLHHVREHWETWNKTFIISVLQIWTVLSHRKCSFMFLWR